MLKNISEILHKEQIIRMNKILINLTELKTKKINRCLFLIHLFNG